MIESKQVVQDLIKKAGNAKNGDDALKFTQAALNASNAVARTLETERQPYGEKKS